MDIVSAFWVYFCDVLVWKSIDDAIYYKESFC